MIYRIPHALTLNVFAICTIILAASSCRNKKVAATGPPAPVSIMAPELAGNGLSALPGAVYQNQKDSPIHWQPWTKETLKRAEEAHRLLFCVIVMPQQPNYQNVLYSLSENSSVLSDINQNYVPVLIDGDASREMGIITADLCAEIRRPLQLPLFVWMTHEGNPVGWIPVANSDSLGVVSAFNQSHQMISQMWKDSSSYVIKNSLQDNTNRHVRFDQRVLSKSISIQPALDVVRSVRQLASMYDVTSRTFDEAGGLFPSGALELLSVAAVHPGLAADIRSRSMETVRDLQEDLMHSAMFDPLDGGVFSSRRGLSWSLPSYVRDCPRQARIAVALLQSYRATGAPQALAKALGVITFAEKSYGTPEGLFAIGLSDSFEISKWMWSVEDVEKELSPEDAAWWIKATGMRGLGNLDSEVDPRREFFRSNTIGLRKSMEELAADQGKSVESILERYGAVKTKLLAVRNQRMPNRFKDSSPNAGACFRMVSAYAAAYGVTGETAYREKAVTLLKRTREVFGVGSHLRTFAQEVPDSLGAGRAFLYALGLQAVLDVTDITSDKSWLEWAQDLAATSAELFVEKQILTECPADARLMDVVVSDAVMLFDDSSLGLFSSTDCRLEARNQPLIERFSDLIKQMPTQALDRPILHTDLLIAALARYYNVTVAVASDVSPEMKTAVERLPLRVIQRRPATPDDEVPSGAVKVFLPDEQIRMVTTPEALREAVLPPPVK